MFNKKLTFGAMFMTVLLFGVSFVSASFGISYPYWSEHPLEMNSGQTKDILFNLQNCPTMNADCDQVDENVALTLLDSGGVAQVKGEDSYFVPFGTADVNIILTVSIPADAVVGDSYNVAFSVRSSPPEGGGNVQLASSYYVSFPINVVEEVQEVPDVEPGEGFRELTLWLIIGSIAILIVIIILIIVLKKKSPEMDSGGIKQPPVKTEISGNAAKVKPVK